MAKHEYSQSDQWADGPVGGIRAAALEHFGDGCCAAEDDVVLSESTEMYDIA